MSLHLIKLCVGVEDIDHLARIQHARTKGKAAGARGALGDGRLVHVTRQMPKRGGELLDGGSIYWVIKRVIQVRQRLLALEKITTEDGRSACALVLDPDLVAVRPRAHRAFQGWRYLTSADAPADLGRGAERGRGDEELPEEMARELRELGLI